MGDAHMENPMRFDRENQGLDRECKLKNHCGLWTKRSVSQSYVGQSCPDLSTGIVEAASSRSGLAVETACVLRVLLAAFSLLVLCVCLPQLRAQSDSNSGDVSHLGSNVGDILPFEGGAALESAAPFVILSSQGPANAPITVVEFSDFECPFS